MPQSASRPWPTPYQPQLQIAAPPTSTTPSSVPPPRPLNEGRQYSNQGNRRPSNRGAREEYTNRPNPNGAPTPFKTEQRVYHTSGNSEPKQDELSE